MQCLPAWSCWFIAPSRARMAEASGPGIVDEGDEEREPGMPASSLPVWETGPRRQAGSCLVRGRCCREEEAELGCRQQQGQTQM